MNLLWFHLATSKAAAQLTKARANSNILQLFIFSFSALELVDGSYFTSPLFLLWVLLGDGGLHSSIGDLTMVFTIPLLPPASQRVADVLTKYLDPPRLELLQDRSLISRHPFSLNLL
jgi:hypothetical protein